MGWILLSQQVSLGSWGLPAGVVVGPRIKQAPLLAYRSPKFRTCMLHGFNIEKSNFFNRMRGPQSIEHKPARNSNNCIYYPLVPNIIVPSMNEPTRLYAACSNKIQTLIHTCICIWNFRMLWNFMTPHPEKSRPKKRKGLWNKMT